MALNKKITQLPSHSDLATVVAMVGVYNGQNVQISGSDMMAGLGGISEVTGSAPLVVAKGTTTPAISIPAANGTTDGYLSSADWTTFNNKTSNTGTVTGVISNSTNQLTVTNGATNAELAIQTGVVAPGSTDLVTSGDIYTGVSGLVGSIDLQTVFDNGAPDAAYNGDVKIASSAGSGSDITLKDGSIEIAADDIKLQGAVNIGTVGSTASVKTLGVDSSGNVVEAASSPITSIAVSNNTMSISNASGPIPSISVITGNVVSGGTSLVTSGQIFNYIDTNAAGTVKSISANNDQFSITNASGPIVQISAVTGAIAKGGLGLVNADNVFTYVEGQGFITVSSVDTLTNKSGNISQWTNDSGYITSASLPTVNDGTLTITVDGTATTFTANQSGDSSVSITTGGSSNEISEGDSNVTVDDTGTDGSITFTTDGTAAWEINNSGHLLHKANDSVDIGSATRKVRDIYVSDGSIKFVGSDNVPKELGINSSGGLEFEGSSVGGDIDLTATPTKQDLTQSSQTQYGEAVVVEASADIDNGAVVIWDYSGGQVRAKMPSGATPDQHEIVGIALDDITSGSTGRVCIYGFATAKYDPSIPSTSVTSLALNSGTTGNTSIVSNSANPCVFTDSGGISGNYTPSVNYTHTFYNEGGNISLKLVDWDFEQASSNIWDRLGFTVSNDGTTYQNAQFTPQTGTTTGGWRRSATSTAPWSTTESTSGNDGYILCADPNTTFPQNTVVDTGYKYVRAYFTSDSGGNQGGWQIDVYGTLEITTTNVPVPGQQCFISINDLTEIDNDANTSRPIGTFFGTDITNDAVVVFVAPNRPQST